MNIWEYENKRIWEYEDTGIWEYWDVRIWEWENMWMTLSLIITFPRVVFSLNQYFGSNYLYSLMHFFLFLLWCFLFNFKLGALVKNTRRTPLNPKSLHPQTSKPQNLKTLKPLNLWKCKPRSPKPLNP